MDYQELARRALQDESPERGEALRVINAPEEEILLLLDAAFRVRRAYFGKKVQIHYLINAKSGICPEDCGYCSQSAVSTARIDRYDLVEDEQLLEGAARAEAAGSRRYCIVISARGPSDEEIEKICRAVSKIKARHRLSICCSLGLIDAAQAVRLSEAGTDRFNHNLNTSVRYYPEICATHAYDDRMNALGAARGAGLELCSGVIFGQGERAEDMLDVCEALRALGPESIPVNFLNPINGTPLGGRPLLGPMACLKLLCLMRFYNPRSEIRVAGGREVQLRELQPLALFPANSIFVDGYLTTPGQESGAARRMIRDAGLEIDVEGHTDPAMPQR